MHLHMPLHSPPSFFFNDTATTEIYTLSLHDALPILPSAPYHKLYRACLKVLPFRSRRSEEHTSELQSLAYLVCRLLLEKKQKERKKRRSDEQQQKHEDTHGAPRVC